MELDVIAESPALKATLLAYHEITALGFAGPKSLFTTTNIGYVCLWVPIFGTSHVTRETLLTHTTEATDRTMAIYAPFLLLTRNAKDGFAHSPLLHIENNWGTTQGAGCFRLRKREGRPQLGVTHRSSSFGLDSFTPSFKGFFPELLQPPLAKSIWRDPAPLSNSLERLFRMEI